MTTKETYQRRVEHAQSVREQEIVEGEETKGKKGRHQDGQRQKPD